jgi:ATP:ADP antiporter, AAA family
MHEGEVRWPGTSQWEGAYEIRFGERQDSPSRVLLCMLGFGAIAVVPTLAAVASFQVLRRAGNYALSQPARQVLYTVVSREDRYKAKNFIDTAVYRAGDQVGAWSYALVGFIGWGIKEAGIIAIVLSALWLANSLWLGKRQEVLAEQQAHAERNNAEAAATA